MSCAWSCVCLHGTAEQEAHVLPPSSRRIMCRYASARASAVALSSRDAKWLRWWLLRALVPRPRCTAGADARVRTALSQQPAPSSAQSSSSAGAGLCAADACDVDRPLQRRDILRRDRARATGARATGALGSPAAAAASSGCCGTACPTASAGASCSVRGTSSSSQQVQNDSMRARTSGGSVCARARQTAF